MTAEEFEQKALEYQIPDHMWDGCWRYLADGVPPGSFLTALFTNNLTEAVLRADAKNKPVIHKWVDFLFNTFPIMSWGSQEVFDEWIRRGGWNGDPNLGMLPGELRNE